MVCNIYRSLGVNWSLPNVTDRAVDGNPVWNNSTYFNANSPNTVGGSSNKVWKKSWHFYVKEFGKLRISIMH